MEFILAREALLKPLQWIVGAVEKKQTMPILANVLLELRDNTLLMTATDSEIEMLVPVPLEKMLQKGETTIPARKLMDICRALPEGSHIHFVFSDQKMLIKSGKSRFTISTLPAEEFPRLEELVGQIELTLLERDLLYLIESTQFSMAQNDVRYYLNGLYFEFKPDSISVVGSDGHRLAFCKLMQNLGNIQGQILLPKKSILELQRLLEHQDRVLNITITEQYIRISTEAYVFISKLIEGRFPDYGRVIPKGGNHILTLDRDPFRDALSRVSILSNEKFRGVKILLKENKLSILTHNELEEAEEELDITYSGDEMEIGFNVTYIQDAIASVPAGLVRLILIDDKSSLMIESLVDENRFYVVMPMRV